MAPVLILALTNHLFPNAACLQLRLKAIYKKWINRSREYSMKTGNHITAYLLVLLFFLFSLTVPALSLAKDDASGVTTNQAIQLTEGKVKKFDPKKQVVTIQVKKREKVKISVNWNTALVGYSSLEEIKKGERVKVWHAVKEETPTAVKMEKKLEGGC